MQNTKKVLIVLLVIVVIAIGYAFYASSIAPSVPSQPSAQNNSSSTPSTTTAAEPTKGNAITVGNAVPSKITAAQVRKLVSDRGAAPTKAQLDAYALGVDAAAVDSTVLDISGCVATPNVLHLLPSATFTAVNKDSVDRSFTYGEKPEVVPANSQKSITLKFPNADKGVVSAIAPFTCDSGTDPVGIFYVTPPPPASR